MLRDVFYYGNKPNVHPREKFAASLEDARSQCTTEHFWIINEYCDYRDFDWDFDFEFLPDEDVWAEEHNNVWPSQHQKDSGTWLCSAQHSEVIIYRADVEPVRRKNTKNKFWVLPQLIDETKFDFSWHPDPTDPDYIYEFGTQWHDRGGPKYVPESIVRLPSGEPIGQIKYIRDVVATLIPDKSKWIIPDNIDTTDFDFSWVPHPDEQPYIHQFGTQWQKTGGPRYIVEGATEIKYINIQRAISLPNRDNWEIPNELVITDFDYSWHHDETDEPYIYVFGNNQYPAEVMPTLRYIPENAVRLPSGKPIGRTIKYVYDVVATLGENKSNWIIPDNVDVSDFDFSWIPNPHDEAFIYQFGTQWQKTGGPKYITPGVHKNSAIKYIDTMKVKKLPNKDNFNVLTNSIIADFDYSWHHDETEESYIYVFGNNQYPAEIMPTIEYVPSNAVKLASGKAIGQIKYVNDIIATLGEDKSKWIIPDNIDTTDFDFSWIPHPDEQPYIHQFGTQWQKTGGPRYIVEGATEVKYVDIQKVRRLPNPNNFNILNNSIIADFDYSWHHDDTDEPYIYVFGNNQYPAEIMPTIQYIPIDPDKLNLGKPIVQKKYVNEIVARLGEDKTNWIIPDNIDVSDFDFSWVPDPHDNLYIYQFGTQWQKTGGPRYFPAKLKELKEKLRGAFKAEIKYVDTQKARRLPNKNNWEFPNDIDLENFDYSWHPDEENESFIYQFGTQWQKTGGPKYITPGVHKNSAIKYIDTSIIKGIKLPNKTNFEILNDIVVESFDYSWHPDETEEPYIYVFGNNQYSAEVMPTIQYIPDAIPRLTSGKPIGQVKYINNVVATLGQNKTNWIIPDDIDSTIFDFSWIPHPNDEPYIYVFGTQHQKTGGPQYVPITIPKMASGKPIGQIKYVDTIKAKKIASKKYWSNVKNTDTTFDFSWHPDDTDPPTTYQFGTLLDREDGPRYTHPDTLDDVVVFMERIERPSVNDIQNIIVSRYEIETNLEDLVKQHPNEIFWALHKNIDYTSFDFDWRPEIVNVQWENEYVYVFGSPDSEITQTYFVNANMYLKGNRDFKFVQTQELTEKYLATLFKKSDMFFVDRSNNESQARFEKLKQKFPSIQKTRYLNSWVDTINRCINRSTTELCWILNSELDYTDFNFEYYPNPWQMKMVHVFGTQWSHWGTTFMVNRETFAQDTKYIKIIEHLSNLNFVKDRKAKATNILYDIVYIDHGNVDVSTLAGKTVIKYQDSYIATFQKLLDILPVKKEHYVWIASTVCDYKDFDFTYICDPFAKEQLHVFPSDRQKFGDTFLVDVNKLRSLIEDMNVLEDYVKINYNQSQRAKRLPAPIIFTESDTHVSTINSDFNFPYATFLTIDNKEIEVVDTEPMSLWSPESKNIQITSVGGTRIVVPKEAKDYVKRELYDYPYITTNSRLAKSSPMDIVFLSNGEIGAEENYQHLLKVTEGLPNRVTRVDGVNGRVQAYHAAAQASNTPWMFTVFAKLKVSNKFDWNWQPDRLQLPKHYVFHARNPVNGLSYGHMAMIAYNKKLTLANQGKGLDFTMDDEHEVLDINSGTANFNTDEWSTWRTAFREALKLRVEDSEISRNRLEMWLTVGMGKYNEYSTEGAQHAVEYYEEVNGDFDKLKLSYDWPWLRAYFNNKYQ